VTRHEAQAAVHQDAPSGGTSGVISGLAAVPGSL